MTSISLCVIAKDEEELLPRMLESVRGVVDEIIVVDTGSTDGTREVARRFGARVIDHSFADDFSEVRNVSLAAATMPWILVLDADEWLEPRSRAALRAAVRADDVAGYYLRFENDLGDGRQHVCGIARLFRNDPSIRFRYFIHEQAIPDLLEYARRTGRRLAPLDAVVIGHDGYLKERCADRDKDRRNERLFLRQVAAHPEHAYSWYKFGDFLRRLDGRLDDARAALEFAARLLRAMDPEEARILSFASEVFALLAVEHDRAGSPELALPLAEEGLARFGETPNLLFVLGHLFAKFGRHRDAFHAYARLRTFEHRLTAIPPEPGITGPVAFLGLGRALVLLGHRRAGRRCLEKSLEANPAQVEARILLARLKLESGDVAGAIDQYRTAHQVCPADGGVNVRLAALLLHEDRPAEALDLLDAARALGIDPTVVEPKRAEALVMMGRLDDAYLALLEAPESPDARSGRLVLEATATGRLPVAQDEASRRWLRRVSAALKPAAT